MAAKSGKPEVDLSHLSAPLAQWLAKQWADATELRVDDFGTPRASGYSNETVFFRARWCEGGAQREARYVLRAEPKRPPVYPYQTQPPRPSVEVQHKAMQGVANAGTGPIAPLIGFEADPELFGVPFYVMGFVEGEVPGDTPIYTKEGFFATAKPEQRLRLVESGLEALAGIHALDCRAAGLEWLADPMGADRCPLARQLEIYRRYAETELGEREHPVLRQAFTWAERELPEARSLGISWGDARPGNMIFEDFRCASITDWEAVALGPPELDLGWWLMFDRFAHEGSGVERLEGDPTRADQRAFYAERSGREIADTRWYEVFAALRFTTVMIRNGDRMTADGLIPVSMNMAINNPATQVLAGLLSISYSWLREAGVG
jgi:aminoglycoside phosphotransferase (APT) family kinase protein